MAETRPDPRAVPKGARVETVEPTKKWNWRFGKFLNFMPKVKQTLYSELRIVIMGLLLFGLGFALGYNQRPSQYAAGNSSSSKQLNRKENCNNTDVYNTRKKRAACRERNKKTKG